MPEEGFLGAFARIAGTFVGGAPDGHKNVWNAIAPWLNELSRSASARWLPHLVMGIPCEIFFHDQRAKVLVPCKQPSIAACAVCRKPCCLNHSFASRTADAVCFACVVTARDSHDSSAPRVPWPAGTAGNPKPPPHSPPPDPAPPPPPREPQETPLDVQYAQARRVLGVKRSATWEEIHAAHRALLKKFHPDRNPGSSRAAQRYLQVRAAHDLLKQAYPEANR
jgi:hypothetical protein